MTIRSFGVALLALVVSVAARAAAEPAPGAEGGVPSASGERYLLVTFVQKPPRQLPRAGSTPRGYGARARYRASPRTLRLAAKVARSYGLRRVDDWPIEALEVHCVVYALAADQKVPDLVARLTDDPRIESAQPMNTFKVLARYDDPYLELQHGVRSMQIEEAHRLARGRGIRVAVVDTGVDVNHPELEGRVGAAEDFVGEGSSSFTADIHGTAVAGVIAAAAGNSIGIVGVAPSVELLALKACWQEDAGSAAASCNSFTLAKAISFAIARRPDVLNLSLAGPPDPLLSRLLTRALDRGVVVVGAADPEVGERGGFPSTVGRVLTVSAAGDGVPPGLSAPGREILTTTPFGAYDFLSGSSLAAAHVTGLAALLLERDRGLSAEEIRQLLSETAAGGLNACVALSRLARPRSRLNLPPEAGDVATEGRTTSEEEPCTPYAPPSSSPQPSS